MDLSTLAVTLALALPGSEGAGTAALAATATDSIPAAIADSSGARVAKATVSHGHHNPLTGALSDVWYVVRSPARINRIGALWIAGFTATTGLLFAYDQEIQDAFQRNKDEPVVKEVMDVGDAVEPLGIMGHTIPYYLGTAALGWSLELVAEGAGGRGAGRWARPIRRIPLQIIESHLMSGGIRNSAKLFIGRRRPHEGRGPRYFEFNGGTSFPSGHTSVAFEIATILSHHIQRPPVTWALYGVAGAMALQRLDSNGHWPSDIVLSGVTGTLVARVVVRRNEERRSVALIPRFEDGKGVTGMMISTSF